MSQFGTGLHVAVGISSFRLKSRSFSGILERQFMYFSPIENDMTILGTELIFDLSVKYSTQIHWLRMEELKRHISVPQRDTNMAAGNQ